jgi:3-oxoacyl-[acyl-carrier-protein] synthase II
VLEELELARSRGATIYGEVLGVGTATAIDRHFVAQRETALKNAIRTALADAGASPRDVGHIHAHGLGSQSSDCDEARAIAAVFGAPADQPPVTAAKSYFGNLGAGGGAVELICSLLAMKHKRLFPILNLEALDPDCPVAAVRASDVSPGQSVLNLNVTQQGQASALLVAGPRP